MHRIPRWNRSVGVFCLTSLLLGLCTNCKQTENIHVYNMLCDSVGLPPVPNNGTMHLPLEVSGLHDPDTRIEDPADDEMWPSASDAAVQTSATSQEASVTELSQSVDVDPVDSNHPAVSTTPAGVMEGETRRTPFRDGGYGLKRRWRTCGIRL